MVEQGLSEKNNSIPLAVFSDEDTAWQGIDAIKEFDVNQVYERGGSGNGPLPENVETVRTKDDDDVEATGPQPTPGGRGECGIF